MQMRVAGENSGYLSRDEGSRLKVLCSIAPRESDGIIFEVEQRSLMRL